MSPDKLPERLVGEKVKGLISKALSGFLKKDYLAYHQNFAFLTF